MKCYGRDYLLVGLAVIVVSGGVAKGATANPVALVESLSPSMTGVSEMSYLIAGTVIRLLPGTTLELDYMESCVHETIKATATTVAEIRIGQQQSEVTAANISREQADCDGRALLRLAATESDVGAAAVWRAPPGTALPSPEATVNGVSPFIVSPDAGKARIELLSVPWTQPIEVVLLRAPGSSRGVSDLASLHIALQPGGLYKITAGGRMRVFMIAESATVDAPLIARLLPL